MPRLISATGVLVVLAALAAPSGQTPPVTYVPERDIAGTLAKSSPATLAKGATYAVTLSVRTGPGEAELHSADTDVFHVIAGGATFVTGGTLVEARTTGPGETRGVRIEGGDARELAPGDIVVVEKGTPHWFKAVPKRFEALVVKVK